MRTRKRDDGIPDVYRSFAHQYGPVLDFANGHQEENQEEVENRRQEGDAGKATAAEVSNS